MVSTFFLADVTVAMITLVYMSSLQGQNARLMQLLFWVGYGFGLTWEVAFYLNGPLFSSKPAYRLLDDYPLPLLTLPFLHAAWDGLLLVTGRRLVQLLCPKPHFAKFNYFELAVLVLWGNLQEITVELLATSLGVWTFVPQAWNPQMFGFCGGAITLMPQLIWTIAPVLFYFIALRLTVHHNRQSWHS